MKTTIALAALLLAGCATKGSGTEAKDERSVSGFTEIEVGGALDVKVEVGPETSVVVVGDDNLTPLVTTEVDGNELELKTTEGVSPVVGLAVKVTMPRLDRLDCGGAADVEVTGLSGERLEVDVGGAGDVKLQGTIDMLELEVGGAGDVHALELEAKSADIDLGGAGDAQVHVTESLRAEVQGAGDVHYKGDPTVDSDLKGSGELKKL